MITYNPGQKQVKQYIVRYLKSKNEFQREYTS